MNCCGVCVVLSVLSDGAPTPVPVSGAAVLAVYFFLGRRRRLAAFSQASFAWVPPHVGCRSPRPEPYAPARETSPSELTKGSTQSTEPRHSLSGFEQRIVTGSRCYFTRDPFVRDSLADCSATDGPCASVTEAAGGAASLPAEKKNWHYLKCSFVVSRPSLR